MNTYSSSLAELVGSLQLYAIASEWHGSRLAQIQTLDAIADECVQQASHRYALETAGNRMGLYDDCNFLYELLGQGWGYWLYSANNNHADALDKQLSKSLIRTSLTIVSFCPWQDLHNMASSALADHCDESTTAQHCLYKPLKEITENLQKSGAPFNNLAISQIEEKWNCLAPRNAESMNALTDLLEWLGDTFMEKPAHPRQAAPRRSFSELNIGASLWGQRNSPQTGNDAPQIDDKEKNTASKPITHAKVKPIEPIALVPLNMHQVKIIHAILGPALTDDLVQTISASNLQNGTLLELTDELKKLQWKKYPEGMLLLASTAHLLGVHGLHLIEENEYPILRAGHTDAAKIFCDVVANSLSLFSVPGWGPHGTFNDKKIYNEWLKHAVEELDWWWWTTFHEEQEEESKTTSNKRRKPRLMDYINRAIGNWARARANRLRKKL